MTEGRKDGRTEGRKDGRTHKGESIGPVGLQPGTKKGAGASMTKIVRL